MFIDDDIINERLNSNENLLFEINSLLKDSEESHSTEKNSQHKESHKELPDKEVTRLLDEALNPDDYRAKRGRGKEKSYEERADIGVLATVLSTNQAADLLGISTGQTANHRNGKVNFYDAPEQTPLRTRLKLKLDEIADVSAEKLLSILNIVDDEAIENLRGSAMKATQVAVNLSRIIDKVKPQGNEEEKSKAVFVIMQPTLAKEEDYGEVINVT